jgi:hypothetical protein
MQRIDRSRTRRAISPARIDHRRMGGSIPFEGFDRYDWHIIWLGVSLHLHPGL